MLTSHETHKIDQMSAREEHLLKQQRDLETEVIELTRLAVIKVRQSSSLNGTDKLL